VLWRPEKALWRRAGKRSQARRSGFAKRTNSRADERFCGTKPNSGIHGAILRSELGDAAREYLRITKRTQSALLEIKLKKRSHCETKPVAKRLVEIVDGLDGFNFTGCGGERRAV